MSPVRILLIEDDPDILELLDYILSQQRYKVYSAKNGEYGLKLCKELCPDLIILDLMLPGMDGLEVCKAIRMDPTIPFAPIIMLTAKSQESDIIVGLELGADDYITKPFSPQELCARVKAILRRSGGLPRHTPSAIRLGPIEIRPDSFEVLQHGQPVPLTLSEFKIFQAMAKKPGKVFTREQLLSALNDDDSYVIDRNIDVHIRAIRKKLQSSASLVQTIRGVGYKCQAYREHRV